VTTDVASDHPDVVWLAEAFTRPAMEHTLAQVGSQQSYVPAHGIYAGYELV